MSATKPDVEIFVPPMTQITTDKGVFTNATDKPILIPKEGFTIWGQKTLTRPNKETP